MRHGRGEAQIIKACAISHQVTEQAVRKWRAKKDKRWLAFMADKAVDGLNYSSPQGGNDTGTRGADDHSSEPEIPETPGEGLMFEIIRARKECLDYARRIRDAQVKKDLETEITLSRILAQNRETLRRLEKDTPGINRDSGESVDKIKVEAEFTSLLSSLRQQLENVPLRIVSALPANLIPEVLPKIEAEINSLFNRLAEVEIHA